MANIPTAVQQLIISLSGLLLEYGLPLWTNARRPNVDSLNSRRSFNEVTMRLRMRGLHLTGCREARR
jgi:hypothetical protein